MKCSFLFAVAKLSIISEINKQTDIFLTAAPRRLKRKNRPAAMLQSGFEYVRE